MFTIAFSELRCIRKMKNVDKQVGLVDLVWKQVYYTVYEINLLHFPNPPLSFHNYIRQVSSECKALSYFFPCLVSFCIKIFSICLHSYFLSITNTFQIQYSVNRFKIFLFIIFIFNFSITPLKNYLFTMRLQQM